MIDNNIAISVKNVSKTFRVYYDKGALLKERLVDRKRNRYENRKVLSDLSFEVKRGEAVGLIGQNGCGKSTTLKLLSRIMYPDSGNIEMRGRVSALIELGAGFHPDMSGRENIYTNASIFGLSRKEIDTRVDDIIAFSELEEYIDNPVRTYSSGMYMRLAFSVAINVDADILLIDEILAVGDVQFQAKCFDALRDIKRRGTTIIVVSHSMGQIEDICDKSIWLMDGKVKEVGIPRYVHAKYLDYLGGKKIERDSTKENTQDKQNSEAISKVEDFGNMFVEMRDIRLFDSNGIERYTYNMGESIELRLKYRRNNQEIIDSDFGFHIFRNDDVDCFGTNTKIDKRDPIILKDEGTISVNFKSMNLSRGSYKIDLALHGRVSMVYHYIYTAVEFEIVNVKDEVGLVHLNYSWKIDEKDLA